MFFLIEESLRPVSREDLKGAKSQYVAVMNSEQWQKTKDSFEMGNWQQYARLGLVD